MQKLQGIPKSMTENTSGMGKGMKDVPPPRPILDALVRRDEEDERDKSKEERVRKVLTWRARVGVGEVRAEQAEQAEQA
jgi:hypothetical protein